MRLTRKQTEHLRKVLDTLEDNRADKAFLLKLSSEMLASFIVDNGYQKRSNP